MHYEKYCVGITHNHFLPVFFFSFSRSFSFFFTQFSWCLSMNTSLNCFSQYSHITFTTFLSYMLSSTLPPSSSPGYYYFFSFFMAFTAERKSYEAAFQLSPVLVLLNPWPLVMPIFFFYSSLFCLTRVACVRWVVPAIWK